MLNIKKLNLSKLSNNYSIHFLKELYPKMGKATETRKLVKWGSSKTLIMSLPRSWTKKHSLTEENEVQVWENPDGSLLILPLEFTRKSDQLEAIIMSEDYPEMQTLSFVIQTKFLDGNDIIRITSKTPFTETRYHEISAVVTQLIGFEIINQTPNEIEIKDIMALKSEGIGKKSGDQLKGVAASPGTVTAPACVVHGPQDFTKMNTGDVLVASLTTPAWTPLFARASAVVTDIGGPLSHGSIVAREYGIPAVLGTDTATSRISNGQLITVDGSAGIVSLS